MTKKSIAVLLAIVLLAVAGAAGYMRLRADIDPNQGSNNSENVEETDDVPELQIENVPEGGLPGTL